MKKNAVILRFRWNYPQNGENHTSSIDQNLHYENVVKKKKKSSSYTTR